MTLSGPKTGTYTLTPEQLKRIHEELERQLKIRAGRSQLSNKIKTITKLMESIDSTVEQYVSSVSLSSFIKELQDLRNIATGVISAASLVCEGENVVSIDAEATRLQQIFKELSLKKEAVLKHLNEAEKEQEEKRSKAINSLGNMSFKNITRKIKNTVDDSIKKVSAVLDGVNTENLSFELLQKLNTLKTQLNLIDSAEHLHNFEIMSVKPFVKECEAYNIFYNANIGAYDQQLAEYQAVAEQVGVTTEAIMFSETAIQVLKEKTEELKKQLEEVSSQEYISKCIDEAMEEMGYQVIGTREVTKKSGRKFRNELYLFDEGTAVNVTYTPNGQITMELGGLDEVDRIPNAAESKGLVDSMEEFCDGYAKLEKILLRKGVITKRISVLPPDEEYAQIINVNDYEMQQDVEPYVVRSNRKRITEQKVMRKG